MKSLGKVILFVVIGLSLSTIFLYKKDSNLDKEVKVESVNKKVLNITEVQLEEIKQEKKIYREQKADIQYKNIKAEEVEIPILMYHSISDRDPSNRLLVSPADFEQQIKWLSDNNFTPMLLNEVVESIKTGNVPIRPVAITFDDGYADNYTDAYQILKKYRMKATFFVITNNIDTNSFYMTSDMLKEMNDYGMDIQNHTVNHSELNKLSYDQQIEEIKGAKDTLKAILNKDSKYLCYPVGRYNDDTIRAQEDIGIEAAVTTNGGFASLDDGFYTLDRVRISPMTINEFSKIFSEFMN